MSIRFGRPQRGEAEDVDEMAVVRAVAGDDVVLTVAEGRLAVAELHSRGMNDNQIADRLHITDRTVVRIRKRLSLPANVTFGRTPIHHPRQPT